MPVGLKFGLVAALALSGLACGGDGDLTADAGEDATISVGEAPTFDGCGSGGDIVNYAWTITGAPADLGDDVGKPLREESSECSFTLESAMVVDEVGSWTIELVVTDGDGGTSSDEVTVDVVP